MGKIKIIQSVERMEKVKGNISKKRFNIVQLMAIIGLLFLLSSCGGGSSSGGGSEEINDPPNNSQTTDTIPDLFSFTSQVGAPLNSLIVSNSITVNGINSPSPISITGQGAAYSVNGGAYTHGSGTVNNGDTVTVRTTSSSSYTTTISATLTIGGVSSTFNVMTIAASGGSADMTPDSFTFISQTGVDRSSEITSNQITVSGVDVPTTISISSSGTYSINEGAYTNTDGIVFNGDTVSVRVSSSPEYNTVVTALLTVGNVAGSFNVTTEMGAATTDSTPNAFSFIPQTNVARSSSITSDSITIQGINTTVPISISGASGTYSINGGDFTSAAGAVGNGNTVRVRLIASSNYNAAVSTVLTIGGITGVFNVTTETGGAQLDTSPDSFSFTTQNGVFTNAIVTSNQITVSGINAPTAVSITGGEATYSINGGDYTDDLGIVFNGDTIRIQMISPTSNDTSLSTYLTIGNVSRSFTVTTLSASETRTGTLTVKVVGSDDAPLPDATVVLGTPDGDMVNYGITDEDGETSFTNPPVNAIITAAHSFIEYDRQHYSIEIYYDINASDITLNIDSGYIDNSLGTGTLTITNSVGAADWDLDGVDEYSQTGVNPSSMYFSLDEDNLQSDGLFSIVAMGYDEDSNLVGYGTLLDQEFSDGMSLNMQIDQTEFGELTYTINNTPEAANSLYCSVNPLRKSQSLGGSGKSIRTTPLPASTVVSYIPGIGDQWRYYSQVSLDSDFNSYKYILRLSDTLSDQTFDFDQCPALPEDISIMNAETDNPIFSWSKNGNGPESYLWIDFDLNSNEIEYDCYIMASPTKSSIVFPQLPESLSGFRPSGIAQYGDLRVEIGYVYASFLTGGYSEWIGLIGQYYNGAYEIPSEYDTRQSIARYTYE